MYKVIFNGDTLLAAHGQLLSDVLIHAGKAVEHPCGGKGICRKCLISVNSENVLSCQYRVESDVVVTFCENADIVSVTGADETGKLTQNTCFVLDIGTTTLALALVSLDEKKVISVETAVNPQRRFGADVISRIDYCRNNGVKPLQLPLIEEINHLISKFNIGKNSPLFVAGNTTMLHLFFGVDCSSIGVSPYTPAFLDIQNSTGSELGISGVSDVISLPCVSSFVGADIVAGLNFVDQPKNGKYNLLIDLGTNAETVLFSADDIVCTAAAAGPCFEGTNISCGMSASDGAVYSFENGKAETINNSLPKGICGTGLVDIISYLLEKDIVDETGYMDCEKYAISDNVFITQEDIRQYQLAKSAVNSAVMTLLKIKEKSFADINKVFISGGFSAKINIASAVKTGLLPRELEDKCVTVNNSSLLGCIKYSIEMNDLSEIINKAEYIDLSLNKDFADLFIENMLFE